MNRILDEPVPVSSATVGLLLAALDWTPGGEIPGVMRETLQALSLLRGQEAEDGAALVAQRDAWVDFALAEREPGRNDVVVARILRSAMRRRRLDEAEWIAEQVPWRWFGECQRLVWRGEFAARRDAILAILWAGEPEMVSWLESQEIGAHGLEWEDLFLIPLDPQDRDRLIQGCPRLSGEALNGRNRGSLRQI